jgi:hypothetical protein
MTIRTAFEEMQSLIRDQGAIGTGAAFVANTCFRLSALCFHTALADGFRGTRTGRGLRQVGRKLEGAADYLCDRYDPDKGK